MLGEYRCSRRWSCRCAGRCRPQEPAAAGSYANRGEPVQRRRKGLATFPLDTLTPLARYSPGTGRPPTLAEAGLPGYEASTRFGLVAPPGTPRDIVARLHGIVVKSLSTPETRKRLLSQGLEPVGHSPEEFARLLRDDLPKWAKGVKESGAKAE